MALARASQHGHCECCCGDVYQTEDALLDYFELLTDCDTRISSPKVDLIRKLAGVFGHGLVYGTRGIVHP